MEDLHQRTNISYAELERQVLALCVNPNARILKKQPDNTRTLAPTDTYTVNKNFTAKRMRIVVNQIKLKGQQKEGTDGTDDKLSTDRSQHMDAAIVRVMKRHKTITHANLVTTVMGAINFKGSVELIKTRIAALIERDLMVRDEGETDTYRYLP
eukprot:Selendium_serpulae@DN5658_c0_g1_i10.p4